MIKIDALQQVFAGSPTIMFLLLVPAAKSSAMIAKLRTQQFLKTTVRVFYHSLKDLEIIINTIAT